MGIALSKTGAMYVCDYGNNAIRKISQGVVSTIAQNVEQPIQITVQDIGYYSYTYKDASPMGIYVVLASGEIRIFDDSPVNDICDYAINLGTVKTTSVTGNNIHAVNPSTIICHIPTLSYSSYSDSGVWYTFTGNGNNITLSTCSAQTTSPFNIFVFRDSSPNLPTACSSLVCMADITNDRNCLHLGVTGSICTQTNMRYYIFISSYYGTQGDFELSITDNGASNCSSCLCTGCGVNNCLGYCPSCPTNNTCVDNECKESSPAEDCAGAIVLPGNTTVSGDLSVASHLPPVIIDEGECGRPSQGGFWYTYQGTGTWVTLSTCSVTNQVENSIFIFEGIPGIPCDENLVCTGDYYYSCPYPQRGAQTHFCAEPETTYYYFISSYGTRGVFDLTQSVTADACKPGDSYYGSYYYYFTSFEIEEEQF